MFYFQPKVNLPVPFLVETGKEISSAVSDQIAQPRHNRSTTLETEIKKNALKNLAPNIADEVREEASSFDSIGDKAFILA
jgi:hypothetical protein